MEGIPQPQAEPEPKKPSKLGKYIRSTLASAALLAATESAKAEVPDSPNNDQDSAQTSEADALEAYHNQPPFLTLKDGVQRPNHTYFRQALETPKEKSLEYWKKNKKMGERVYDRIHFLHSLGMNQHFAYFNKKGEFAPDKIDKNELSSRIQFGSERNKIDMPQILEKIYERYDTDLDGGLDAKEITTALADFDVSMVDRNLAVAYLKHTDIFTEGKITPSDAKDLLKKQGLWPMELSKIPPNQQ